MFHLRTVLFFPLAAAVSVPIYTNQACNTSNIFEATYSYPAANDSSIFNVHANSSDYDVLPTQLQGRVYWPRGEAQEYSVPLVLLLSGKHPDCRTMVTVDMFGQYPVDGGAVNSQGQCPLNQTVVQGYRGFDYLGRQLAANGIAAISVDPLLLNNPPTSPENDPYLSAARARLLLKTIEKVRSWNKNPQESLAAIGYDISRTLNFSSIGLMGHSRGGAGARLAYNMVMTPQRLPVREIYDWTQHLNVSIRGVVEVAPLDVVEQHTFTAVVGSPWLLVGAGCESDEVDYGMLLRSPIPPTVFDEKIGYYRLAQRQSRLNGRPNYFLNVFGASHEYFNSEWHQAIDACIGDQENLWNTSAPQFNLSGPQGENFSIPLVLGSQRQQEALSYPLLNFFKAYLGISEEPSLMETFKAGVNHSTLQMRPDVEIGLSNPNVGTSDLLQDFATYNSSKVIGVPNEYLVESISNHARNQFPVFRSQVGKFGLPSFYNTLLGNVLTSGLNFSFAKNAAYDNGIVISLPRMIEKPVKIQIPLKSSSTQRSPTHKCSVHIDVARRSNCFLPSSAASNNNDFSTRIAKRCAQPRELVFQSRVRTISGNGYQTITHTADVKLKSRFNFEWGPYNFSGSLANEIPIGLLPVAWETIVMDETRQFDVDSNTFKADAIGKSILELAFDTTLDDSKDGAEIKLGKDTAVSDDFLYIGIIRRVC